MSEEVAGQNAKTFSGVAEVDYQASLGLFSSTQRCRLYTHIATTTREMAPSLEEPVQVDFEAPLKAAPKLVAPEPGRFAPPLCYSRSDD